MEAADDFFVFFWGGGGYVDQYLMKELEASSHDYCVFVVPQCREITTQKGADTQEIMSPKLACRGKNWRHCCLLPTCCRHVANITSQGYRRPRLLRLHPFLAAAATIRHGAIHILRSCCPSAFANPPPLNNKKCFTKNNILRRTR